MTRTAYLRRQAETCLRLSDSCQDALTAEHLRLMAAEYFQKATDIEGGLVAPYDKVAQRAGWDATALSG